jgi:hypothetical protein
VPNKLAAAIHSLRLTAEPIRAFQSPELMFITAIQGGHAEKEALLVQNCVAEPPFWDLTRRVAAHSARPLKIEDFGGCLRQSQKLHGVMVELEASEGQNFFFGNRKVLSGQSESGFHCSTHSNHEPFYSLAIKALNRAHK